MQEDIEAVLKCWTDGEEIRLRAGEIDRETMRTVLAVTRAMAWNVREVLGMNEAPTTIHDMNIDWIDCPTCGEPDMQKKNGIIYCVNLSCSSYNGRGGQGDDNDKD